MVENGTNKYQEVFDEHVLISMPFEATTTVV
jgi:uncharacterized protein (DUF169 family)